jgi:succinyl-diaminopimelate desuccinylase
MLPTDEHLEGRLVRLTRDLVLIESTDSRPDERARCFQLINNHLEGLDGIRLLDHHCGDYASLLALPDGIDEPDVLLCAHLDVVEHPEPGSYRSELRDGRIYGPGAGDMKGALAILLELFRKWHGRQARVSLGLVVTSDEEIGGDCGLRSLVEDRGLRCGVAIIPDGGSLNEITSEEKGILHLELTANGRSAHAARPWLGENAIEKMVGALSRIGEKFSTVPSIQADDEHWRPTCSATVISADNDSFNRIPDIARATLDVRYPAPHERDEVLGWIRDAMGPGIELRIEVAAEPTKLAPDPAFVKITAEVTGTTPELVRACGGSDGRFLSRHQISVLLSRPKVGNLHNPDEWIDIASMQTYHEICDRYLQQRFA